MRNNPTKPSIDRRESEESVGKVLRVGIAMGGGVSLGDFCGAALTEALKWLVLYGRDERGEAYDEVVLDVLSGSSAGAMSLGLLLRALAEPVPLGSDRRGESRVRDRLKGEFGSDFVNASPKTRGQLEAIQVAQDLQYQAWVERIHLDALLQGQNGSMRYVPSFLNRGAVDCIAADLLGMRPGEDAFKARSLLAERVLFCCTLCRLTPMVVDARGSLAASMDGRFLSHVGYVGLNDGLRSQEHRDYRVFDFHFGSGLSDSATKVSERQARFPGRWFRYHVGEERPGVVGDLRTSTCWARVAATCIASGAFPLAFEPVVLERMRWEYHPDQWPEPLAHRDRYPFAFVDGGTLNNEPIREAFRMASFMDAMRPERPFDRRILFVDPFVSSAVQFMPLALHEPMHLDERLMETRVLQRKASLDRMVSALPTLVTAVLNEARKHESDKIYLTRDRFRLRDRYRAMLAAGLDGKPAKEQLEALAGEVESMLNRNAVCSAIPPGGMDLESELARVIREEALSLPQAVGEIRQELEAARQGKTTHSGLWLRALNFVFLDLMMDLEGKHASTHLVAISPFDVPDLSDPGCFRQIPLQGAPLSGFAGFMSKHARDYDFQVGRYCARQFLCLCGLVDEARLGGGRKPRQIPRLSDVQRLEIQESIQRGMVQLGSRAADLLKHFRSVGLPAGWVDRLAKTLVSRILAERIGQLNPVDDQWHAYAFRISVDTPDFELDGKGLRDRDQRAQPFGEAYALTTFLEYQISTGTWRGYHLRHGFIRVDRDRKGILKDQAFCQLRPPSPRQVQKANGMTHPVFCCALTQADQGHELNRSRWKVQDELTPLEHALETMMDRSASASTD